MRCLDHVLQLELGEFELRRALCFRHYYLWAIATIIAVQGAALIHLVVLIHFFVFFSFFLLLVC